MFAPSVQLVKVYPIAGTADTETEAPELNEPPPFVVPPANGLAERDTENCDAKKLAVIFLSEFIITVNGLVLPTASPLHEINE